MPVRRFRSVADMEDTVWLERDDPQLWATIRAVWALADRLHPVRFPPGVYRHRTIEDLNAQTEAWERYLPPPRKIPAE